MYFYFNLKKRFYINIFFWSPGEDEQNTMDEGNEPKDEEDVEEDSVINSRLEEEVSNTQSTKENDETLHLDHTQTNKVLLVN